MPGQVDGEAVDQPAQTNRTRGNPGHTGRMSFEDHFERITESDAIHKRTEQRRRDGARQRFLREVDELAEALPPAGRLLAKRRIPGDPVVEWSPWRRNAILRDTIWSFHGLHVNGRGEIFYLTHHRDFVGRDARLLKSVGLDRFYYEFGAPVDLNSNNVCMSSDGRHQYLQFISPPLKTYVDIGPSGHLLFWGTGMHDRRPPIDLLVAQWARDLIALSE